jgi:hypothetical protein
MMFLSLLEPVFPYSADGGDEHVHHLPDRIERPINQFALV